MRNAEAALASLEGTGAGALPGSGELPRVFLIYGEEPYYQTRLVRAIRRLTLDQALEAFNYTFLEHEAATAAVVRSAVLTLPMMADCRLVVVRDPAELLPARPGRRRGGDQADEEPDDGEVSRGGPSPETGRVSVVEIPAPATDGTGSVSFADSAGTSETPPASPGEIAQRWSALLEDVPPQSRLVLTLSWELPESSPLLRAAAKLKPAADVIRCLPAAPRSAETWVRKMVTEMGGAIDSDAAQALVMRSGSSLAILEGEVRKLLAYAAAPGTGPGTGSGVGPVTRVTARDVHEVATPSAEASVFEMVDHLGNRRPYQAVSKMRRLVEQGEAPLGLMAMVTRQVRLVFLAREMLAIGAPVRDIEKRLGLPTFIVRNYLVQARNFDRPQLIRMMRSLGRMDLDVKTGRQDPVEALELFILQQG